jgi:hypothetical protein
MHTIKNWSEILTEDWANTADCIIFELMEQGTFDLEDFRSKAREKYMPPRQISKFESKAIRAFVQFGYLEKTDCGYKKAK